MASSSAGDHAVNTKDAVEVLIHSLDDESSVVREASMAALYEIAPLNPMLVLDCCSVISRGGRKRFGNIAGVFTVMAHAVRAIDSKDVDPFFMSKLVKITLAEMISSKDVNADWQRAASGLVVAIGMHMPDLPHEGRKPKFLLFKLLDQMVDHFKIIHAIQCRESSFLT